VNRALAARVAVYREQWADALTDISQSFFSLAGGFYTGAFEVFSTSSGDILNPVYVGQNQNGEVRLAEPHFTTEILPGDDRINKATLRDAPASKDGLTSDRDVWVYTSSTAPIPIIRNEELILIYAEAKIQTNDFNAAVTALNVIRKGHNLPNYSGVVAHDPLINEMLYQRRYSLYFEGHRWIDMRRYGMLHPNPAKGIPGLPIARTEPTDGDNVWDEFPLPSTE